MKNWLMLLWEGTNSVEKVIKPIVPKIVNNETELIRLGRIRKWRIYHTKDGKEHFFEITAMRGRFSIQAPQLHGGYRLSSLTKQQFEEECTNTFKSDGKQVYAFIVQ